MFLTRARCTSRPLRSCRRTISNGNPSDEHRGSINGATHKLRVQELPPKAKVVICGGGATGAAVAYKLAQRGLGPETVLIDKGEVGGGTTVHASGLVGMLKQSKVETKLCKISKELYLELEEMGFYTGWKQCGSVHVAQTKERLHHFRRLKSEAVGRGVECEIVTPDRISELCPLVRTDDLLGGLWIPGDCVANPFEICVALSVLAQARGVTLVSNCEVQEVVSKHGAITGVRTNQGFIECDNFVNTASAWARHVGTLSYPRVGVPMHAVEHYFLRTKAMPQLMPDCPIIRDPDGHVYFREDDGRFLAGGFEPEAKPIDGNVVLQELLPDWDHFYVLMKAMLHRVPCLLDAYPEKLTNAPEPFSPDGQWILGKAPEIRNYFVATAMRSNGVGAAGGVGEVIADYITEGNTKFDMYNLDIQRFIAIHNNRKFLHDRVKEVPGLIYAIPYPFKEYKTGRALRTSPIFTKLKDLGARFNQVMGYERPMYFNKKESEDKQFLGLSSYIQGDTDSSSLNVATSNTFFKPSWFESVKEEFVASRESVSLCDYSSFAKMDIWSGGLEVVDFLQFMCSNDIDIPIGHIIHTGMQNKDGGYENDCTLARLADNRYLLMSPSTQQMRSFSWMKHHLPTDNSVFLEDVTSLYTSLCLIGPKAKKVLSKLTSTSIDSKDFPFFTIRHLDIGMAPDVLTCNVTHVGELGYVMYIPNEFALHVFEALVEAGEEFDIKQCGYYAMRALRIEKFYAFWGQDLDSQSTPLECGRAFRVKMKSDIDFLGREALQRQMDEGINKMLVMLLLDDKEHDLEADPWPWGGEPIFRDGKYVGSVTTTSYGFSLKKHVALGSIYNFADDGDAKQSVTPEYVKSGEYEIEIAGTRYPAIVRLQPPVLPHIRKANVEGGYEATRYNATL